MKNVQMKIVGYDEQTLSLLVKFAYSDSAAGIDASPILSYQPYTMFPDVTDVQELVKRIAVSGISVCDQQERFEKTVSDTEMKSKLQGIVDQTFEYTLEDLLTPPAV